MFNLFKKSPEDVLVEALKTGKVSNISEDDLKYLEKKGYFKPITKRYELDDYLRHPGCDDLSPGCLEYKEQLKTALDDGKRVFFNNLKSGKKTPVCNYKCLIILPPEGSE